MLSLSAVIITLNEARNLPRLLQSLQGIADEVIVVDSRSSDGTAEMAAAAGAKVISEPFRGYGPQKSLGISVATGDLIFCVDADEELSEALRRSMLAEKAGPQFDAYYCSRLTNYCGAWIRHGGWYPDRVLRMWQRGKAVQSLDAVHEKIEAVPGASTGQLRGDLLHYSFPTLASHLRKIELYATAGARYDVERGKKVSLLKLLFGPGWVFIQMYLLKLGLLDGFYGFVIARNSAFAAFAKYVAIRHFSLLKKRSLPY